MSGINRRTFIKALAAAGTGVLLNQHEDISTFGREMAEYFSVHPFIENHPGSVFIMRTNVDIKTDSEAKKNVGLEFGRSVFVHTDEVESGLSLNNKIVIKPNLTCRGKWDSKYTKVGSMGVITDVFFVEGVIESMKELGMSGEQFYIREVNCPEDFEEGGYPGMAVRTGADMRDLSRKVGEISENDLQWIDVPYGVWFNKIPYLWPVNAPGTMLLNISKFKAHAMGLTLCAKNIQGTIAHNYQEHCLEHDKDMDISAEHIIPDAKLKILENYNRRKAEGIPRWDKPGSLGGLAGIRRGE